MNRAQAGRIQYYAKSPQSAGFIAVKRSIFGEARSVLQSVVNANAYKCVWVCVCISPTPVVGEVHCHVMFGFHVENSKVLLQQTSYPFILLALFYFLSLLFLVRFLFHVLHQGDFCDGLANARVVCNVL